MSTRITKPDTATPAPLTAEEKREKQRAYDKAYYQAHRERILARKHQYFLMNIERERAKRRERARFSKGRERASEKAYREANREKVLARQRARYQANKAWWIARRERNQTIIKRFLGNNGCFACSWGKGGTGEGLHTHHVGPKAYTVSQMVTYSIRRLVRELAATLPMCPKCHALLHAGKLSILWPLPECVMTPRAES